ncbi:MAG: diguanylate cyclase [Spirochaetia bacterium]
MKEIHILILDTQDDLYTSFFQEIDFCDPVPEFFLSGREALAQFAETEYQLAIINPDIPHIDEREFCKKLKRLSYMKPFQLILIIPEDSKRNIKECLDCGIDDFIRRPVGVLEFYSRIKAAYIRLENQYELVEEREYYRNAVIQEERLSSRILDQNMYLKNVNRNIQKMNEELEKVNKELEKVAKYDSLSGLLNRISLFAVLDIEIERAVRNNGTLSGIMMDIDHFKRINDNYGHQCGDAVIREIGNELKDRLRKYDHAGRYGGEEFFIILPNTTLNQAAQIAKRFREDLENMSIACREDTLTVTASMGVAQFKNDRESREEWISRADKALYTAKERGRNCVETW